MDQDGFEHTDRAIRQALAAQGFMRLVGAEVAEITPGRVVLALQRRDEVLQHMGYFHGGAIAFLIDNATTCAAATLVDRAQQSCLTAEYKLNFLSPGAGDRLVCEAQVIKPGRAITVVEAKVYSEPADGSARKLCAVALATIAMVMVQPSAKAA